MPKFVDLTGQTFSFWTVTKRVENRGSSACWSCVCVCGTVREYKSQHITSELAKSCGCQKINVPRKHGAAVRGKFTKKYKTWRAVRGRCLNPNHKNADIYHGLLCEEWLDYSKFDSDVPDPTDDSLTIDRIDNKLGYEPGNVRWVTMAEQHRNQSNCRWIEFNGKRQLLTDWSKELGIGIAGLSRRIDLYGVEVALTTSIGKRLAPAHNKLFLTRDGITDDVYGWMGRLDRTYQQIHAMKNKGMFHVENK